MDDQNKLVSLKSTSDRGNSGAEQQQFDISAFDHAFWTAAAAMRAEQDRDPERALQLYEEAVGMFLSVMKNASSKMDERSNHLLRKHISDFLTRAELLKTQLRMLGRLSSRPTAAVSPAQAPAVEVGTAGSAQFHSNMASPPIQTRLQPIVSQHYTPSPQQPVQQWQERPEWSPRAQPAPAMTGQQVPPTAGTNCMNVQPIAPPDGAGGTGDGSWYLDRQPVAGHPTVANDSSSPSEGDVDAGNLVSGSLLRRLSSATKFVASATTQAVKATVSVTHSVTGNVTDGAAGLAAQLKSQVLPEQVVVPKGEIALAVSSVPHVNLSATLPTAPIAPLSRNMQVTEIVPVDGSTAGLRPGWTCYIDESTKIPYYYNSETEETTWERETAAELEVGSGEETSVPANDSNSADALGRSETETEAAIAELSELKDRLGKLLLGDDYSGGNASKQSALAVSNAITNLAVGTLGELKKLMPMPKEHIDKWRKELGWLLAPLDHIVVREPGMKQLPDGSEVEVMVSVQRKDIRENLPLLSKMDALLVEVLNAFAGQKFIKYEKPSSEEAAATGKWWVEVPRLPHGLSDEERRCIQNCVACCQEVLIRARAINQIILDAISAPEKLVATLPWNSTPILGQALSSYIKEHDEGSEPLDVNVLFKLAGVCDEADANALLDKLHRAKLVLTRKLDKKDTAFSSLSIKERPMYAARVMKISACEAVIKGSFPGMRQTSVETAKIAENLDVGLAALEAYSRVIESRSATILSRLQDVLAQDAEHVSMTSVSGAQTDPS